MATRFSRSPQRLLHHVQELERLETLKRRASDDLRDAFEAAAHAGFDPAMLKVVLKLRKLTPDQRRERRALEAIYLASLGMLEGDPLTDEARRRLDGPRPDPPPEPPSARAPDAAGTTPPPTPGQAQQAPLILKTPDEAKQEGMQAAAAEKRIYDNPYPAGDPCRAAWDEGWCAQQKSHGMDTPSAYRRREAKPADGDAKKKGAA